MEGGNKSFEQVEAGGKHRSPSEALRFTSLFAPKLQEYISGHGLLIFIEYLSGDISGGEKVEVSWNNVYVNYESLHSS